MQLDPTAFVADSELLQALEKRAKSVDCGDDFVLFHQGDTPAGLYILQKGEVTLTMDSIDDGPIFSCCATSGSLLGLPGLIGNQPYTLSAVARHGAKLSFIPRNDFNALMQADLSLMVKVLEVLAAEVRSARLAITQL